MIEIRDTLAQITGREIDLNDMHKLPVTFKVQIVTKGERIYCSNQVESETYDTHILSDYVRLNEERQYILQDIQHRAQYFK